MTPRLVGINHVALQVDDIEEAVAFYTDLFQPTDVSRIPGAAFLRMGDQFLALFERGPRTEEPHFGLVVDDKEAARRAFEEAGVETLPGRFFDIRDPSGNRLQIVQYDQIQFTKTDRILRGMGLELGKSELALEELRARQWPLAPRHVTRPLTIARIEPAAQRTCAAGATDSRAGTAAAGQPRAPTAKIPPIKASTPANLIGSRGRLLLSPESRASYCRRSAR
jgi:predicted enzyme related to lactoylglutathione lyase